ncbi:MAG: sigma-70 family RNA polymerase sigma factor [Bacteroidota bacterium]
MHIARDYNDQEVVHAIKTEKDIDEAIQFIYREYYGLLENYVRNNSGNEDDAADIIQEAIVAFIEMVKKEKYRGQASVKSLLFTLTRNLWISELRKRKSATRRHEVYEDTRDDIEQDVSEHLAYKEKQALIIALLDQLGSTCRKILELFYYQNLSIKEILEQLPQYTNEQVIRNKKYKCLKELVSNVKSSPTIIENLKTMSRYVEY